MKKILFFLKILLLSFQSYAQLVDLPNYSFEFSYLGKIKTKNVTTNYNGILLQNDTISAWGEEISNDNVIISNDSLKQIITQKEFTYIIFKNFIKNEMVFTQTGGFLDKKINAFSDTINMFKWVLQKEETVINNFKCKKAFCEFRGRKYEAWYAPAIPLNNGPWKFGNLPGLIIEIFSIDKYVSWKLTGITKSNKIIPKAVSTNLTFLDYTKKVRRGYKRFLESVGATDQIDPTCKSCQTTRIIKIESTENIFN